MHYLVRLKKIKLIETILHTEKVKVEPCNITNVVLADNHDEDVLIFQLAIEELNIPISLIHVSDGDRLLALLRQPLPDIMFIDVEMPCKDGVACILEIRKNKAFDNVPIILITGHPHRKYIEQAFSYGANYYLIKANTVEDLCESLKRIFSIDWKKNNVLPSGRRICNQQYWGEYLK
jgi:CheY-like chemotaxis protein